ncbi:ABC transporter transmembrane domain-containing protein [Aureimonas pseudogalii]|uniref:ATP-binding cassette subfamily B protein n=1 Tax=Aureimonas pseudogalii TaxID=1744844 RepID=A0A7W6H2X4_9HYPH|nr:ABC transporter transmembrane domain-containing protein [Aureimonas pseudogalii]MBB3997456.1 ATP-binding cassette subfamily B protein [Aureimonas pseudogalii]
MAETTASGVAAPKPRKTLKPLARLAPYVLRQRKLVAGALVFLILASITTLSFPLAVRRVVDHGFQSGDTSFVDTYFAMLAVLSVVLALSSAGRYYFVITIGERVVAELRKDVFDHVLTLSPAFYDRNLSGEIVSRLTADTTQIKSAVGATASMALRNVILFVGALAMMAWTSPGLSLIVIAAIPLIVAPLVAFGRSVRRRSRAAQDRLATASAYAGEAISAVRTVQAFTGEPAARARFAASVDEAFEAARRSVTARALLTAFAIFLITTSIVLVLWIGAGQVIAGTMSAGTLGQFLLYAVFAASSLGQLSEVWGDLTAAAGATERLSELLEEEPAIRSPAQPLALPVRALGDIRFEGVSFRYPGADARPTLHDLTFTVRPGETVALVGPSGAGKSTIFALLERFYDPTSGRILVDGVDIAATDLGTLRRRTALVPQDTTIFAGTVASNIAFGEPDASPARVAAAAEAAQAERFIAAMPQGFETEIGERGVTLSGGQRQRIAIARAVLRDAPILLLDEATSALDAESEVLVQRALDRLMTGRTTLVIAHRLATILKADRILVLDGGRIVEEGTHAALIARGGLYARLARLQFEAGHAALTPTAAE